MSTPLWFMHVYMKKKRTYRTHRSCITPHGCHSRALNLHFVLCEELNSTFSLILVKSLGQGHGAVMSWLRNASFLFAEFVPLLGDSGPRLLLTWSWLENGLWTLDVIRCDVSEYPGF